MRTHLIRFDVRHASDESLVWPHRIFVVSIRFAMARERARSNSQSVSRLVNFIEIVIK